MGKEKWIEEILTTVEGVSNVEAREELWVGIKNRLGKPKVVSATVLWIAAASLALLVALNVVALKQSETTGANSASAGSYSLTESNFNLY